MKRGVLIDSGHSLHVVKPEKLDAISVCRPLEIEICSGDRLQLKANATGVTGAKFANGEIVTVAKIKRTGEIALADGRTLPPSYRQFVRGYAVTSYGSQGKTVDYVLLSDSGSRSATNSQQWYVSISRGRKSIRIFTPDRAALRHQSPAPATARSLSIWHSQLRISGETMVALSGRCGPVANSPSSSARGGCVHGWPPC